MTSVSAGPLTELFFTNVLNGTMGAGRLGGRPGDRRQSAPLHSGRRGAEDVGDVGDRLRFTEELNSAAVVIGPTGVALGTMARSTSPTRLINRITSIPFAVFRFQSGGVGDPVSTGGDLNAPLGLATASMGLAGGQRG